MTSVVIRPGALAALLESPEGPVGRMLQVRAEEVTAKATINAEGADVPGAVNTEGRGPRIRTGNLSTSIRYVVANEGGLYAAIGSDVFYSTYLEKGFMGGWNHDKFLKFPFLLPALIQLGYEPVVRP